MSSSLPIFLFHTLEDKPANISFAPGRFRRGMARLSEAGHRALSLLEAVDCLRRGAGFPARSMVLTFDDGYRTVYTEAFPVLQRYGFAATVFLTVGERGLARSVVRLPAIKGHAMLAWDEIREMQRWGITFGAHTLTHPNLTRLPPERIEAEVCESKAIIEDTLGQPVASFAYPFGRSHPQSREIVRQHFECACSDTLGLIGLKSEPYTLERVDAYYLRSDWLFDFIAARRFRWYIGARSVARRIRRAAYWRPG
jgi:peptidoglycan/xylan/chitin deacetylase (PgdA/CDA1 family)